MTLLYGVTEQGAEVPLLADGQGRLMAVGEKGKDGADSTVPGDKGDKGDKGEPGAGVPAGGVTGQLLAKVGPADYAAGWTDPPDGTSGGVVVHAVSSVRDPLEEFVLWAANFNGVAGSATFRNAYQGGDHVRIRAAGGAALSGDWSSYGTTSLFTNGESAYALAEGSCLTTIGGQDLCYEFDVKVENLSVTRILFDWNPIGTPGARPLGPVLLWGTDGKMSMLQDSVWFYDSGTVIDVSQPHRVSFCRRAGKARLHIDGMQIGPEVDWTMPVRSFAHLINKGCDLNWPGVMYINRARLTVGDSRYWGSYLPPTGPLAQAVYALPSPAGVGEVASDGRDLLVCTSGGSPGGWLRLAANPL